MVLSRPDAARGCPARAPRGCFYWFPEQLDETMLIELTMSAPPRPIDDDEPIEPEAPDEPVAPADEPLLDPPAWLPDWLPPALALLPVLEPDVLDPLPIEELEPPRPDHCPVTLTCWLTCDERSTPLPADRWMSRPPWLPDAIDPLAPDCPAPDCEPPAVLPLAPLLLDPAPLALLPLEPPLALVPLVAPPPYEEPELPAPPPMIEAFFRTKPPELPLLLLAPPALLLAPLLELLLPLPESRIRHPVAVTVRPLWLPAPLLDD